MKHAFPFVAGAAFLVFCYESQETIRTKLALHRMEKEASHKISALSSASAAPVDGLESALSAAAKKSGTRRLLSVNSGESRGARIIELEWEGSQQATVQFLSLLQSTSTVGICSGLRITGSPAEPGLLRARGTFEMGAARVRSDRPNGAPALARDVFAPLWRDATGSDPVRLAREQKKMEEVRLREQQRADEERRGQEEARRIEEKRRGLETQLVVTGIVHNGREAMAFMNRHNAGGQTVMVRSGDLIEEAKVTNIDEKKGEVWLDYLGKFQTVLKIN